MKTAHSLMILCLFTLSAAASGQTAPPQVTILGNGIDIPLNTGYIDTLKAIGFDVAVIGAGELPQHQSDPLILILGGQDAPDGVGTIVGGILTDKEKKDTLSNPGAKNTNVIPSLWTDRQKVMVFAGYGKEQTRKAFGEAQGDIIKTLKFNDSAYIENYTMSAQVDVPPIDGTQPFTEIDAFQAASLLNASSGIFLMDVRGAPFYAAGHIPAAVNIPQAKLDGYLGSLDKQATYVVYCGGNSESIRASNELAAAGFKSVYRIVDGYMAWRKAGFPRAR